tara:strand:- start:5143 stop:5874 length:732 start_codon:yes stop_codon:yes gene_type:complete
MSTRSSERAAKKSIEQTWGARCDLLLFIDQDTEGMRIDWDDNYGALARKSHQVWTLIHRKYGEQFDFFMKADFDTYILMENMIKYLGSFDHRQPYYLGKQLLHPKFGPFVAGAAVVMSQAALSMLYAATSRDSESCSEEYFATFGGQDDLALGVCLQTIGIYPQNSRTLANEERFMVFDVDYMYDTTSSGVTSQQWYMNMSFNTVFGRGCCSEDAIVFHMVARADLYRVLKYKNGRWSWAPAS